MPIKPTRLSALIRRLEGDEVAEFGPYKLLRMGPGGVKFKCAEYLAPGPMVRFQMRYQTQEWRELDRLSTAQIIPPYTYTAGFVDRHYSD